MSVHTHYTSVRHLSPFIFYVSLVFFSILLSLFALENFFAWPLYSSQRYRLIIINESAWIVCRPVDVWLHDLSTLVWMSGTSCRARFDSPSGVCCACSIGIVSLHLHTKFRCFGVSRAHTLNRAWTYGVCCYRMCSQLLSPTSQYSRTENCNKSDHHSHWTSHAAIYWEKIAIFHHII